MLTKQDLAAIAQIIDARLEVRLKETEKRIEKSTDEKVKNGFSEFYDSIFMAYAQHNEEDHEKIKELINEKFGDVAEYIKDHEKRITRLETSVSH